MPTCQVRLLAAVARLVAANTVVGLPSSTYADDGGASDRRAVKVIADQRLTVTNVVGTGAFPLYVSADWTQPLPDITRAVLVFHGKFRNADVYNRSAMSALAAAGEAGHGTLLITPQFLTSADVAAHKLPDAMLRWRGTAWMGGESALAPARLSSFDAIDAIVARLADRSLYPKLTQVIVAGHSGGGQFVQRYAVVGQGEAALREAGVQIRYVIANPSSYVYFNEDRPRSDGTIAPFKAADCAGFNLWKYGMDDKPAYTAEKSSEEIERDYARRDVIYLLGTGDINPNHPALDKSCEAEAQGPHRFARGHAYFDYIRNRNQREFNHRLYDVAGVGHQGGKMLKSPCGLAALFANAQC